MKQFCILQLPIESFKVNFIMVTITRQVFINIPQMEHIRYEKNMRILVIPKSPNVGKKVKKIGLGYVQTKVS